MRVIWPGPAMRRRKEIVAWYRTNVGPDLARRVERRFRDIVQLYSRRPAWGVPIDGDEERKIIEREFGYAIVYRIRHGRLEVLDIYSQKEDR